MMHKTKVVFGKILEKRKNVWVKTTNPQSPVIKITLNKMLLKKLKKNLIKNEQRRPDYKSWRVPRCPQGTLL